jgi:hypothetical protein
MSRLVLVNPGGSQPARQAAPNGFIPASDLADAATAPAQAAASAAATTRAAPPTTSAGAASAAAAAAPPHNIGNFLTHLRCCGVFSVEDIERRQTDVGDFLLTEKDFVIW